MSKRLKHDVRYLISAILLIFAAVAILTGWLADAWGINTFVFHTYSGYGMAFLALIHTVLEWPRLWAYARARLRRRAAPERPAVTVEQPTLAADAPLSETPPPTSDEKSAKKPFVTRRELLGMLAGGALGFAWGWRSSPPSRMEDDADWGVQYHNWSKPSTANFLSPLLDWGQRPAQHKVYPDAPRISLPAPGAASGLSLEAAIRQRRSRRGYSGATMTQATLSRLLFHAGGITAEPLGMRLRAAPSAGALYPIEIYVSAHQVEGLEEGLYHYAVQEHALAQVRVGDVRADLVRAGLLQSFLGEANVVLILTAVFQRLRWKYRERAYRYALLEAGHIGQNVYLAATAMGMGACAVGAFFDDALNTFVEVDGVEEAALYVLAVGEQANV